MIVAVALFWLVALVMAVRAYRKRTTRQPPLPRTWAAFCDDPRPIVASDIPLYPGEMVTVYNTAAARLRMGL